jgi:hypothetical protein
MRLVFIQVVLAAVVVAACSADNTSNADAGDPSQCSPNEVPPCACTPGARHACQTCPYSVECNAAGRWDRICECGLADSGGFDAPPHDVFVPPVDSSADVDDADAASVADATVDGG